MPIKTLADLLAAGADDAPAIGAPDCPSLDHAGLRALVKATGAALAAMGLGRRDRVAILLPNGPEMAAAFVAIASAAVAVPLNPALQDEEFAFALADLGVTALIIQAGLPRPARIVANRLGIPIVALHPTRGAGGFVLAAPEGLARAPTSLTAATPSDVALMLHTSGTTARPKIVPLTQANITASAAQIGHTLQLGPGDVCLNIMPLFHIHGLIAAVLASLAAGGAVSCAPAFEAGAMFGWLDAVRPTWFTAVPTMHQALTSLAESRPEPLDPGRLRFIRSSSASLPPPVMARIEAAFGVPLIEAYGMTEAAHQMASNPLPPLERRPGWVGMAAGPEIAIMDAAGALLPVGQIGEVVIRGANVTAGYAENPEANARSFVDGWFRTGDQGLLDAQHYLRLTGRLKEIINRGGEKISPLEIDAVLMDHPAVANAVTFAVPHETLGEDVAAAIVLRAGAALDEATLRAFCAARIAAFKVPRRIVFLDEIPKGATGKFQRIGLAERLGQAGSAAGRVPTSAIERALAETWRTVLGVAPPGVDADFFALGGDSLALATLFSAIEARFGRHPSLDVLGGGLTIAGLAAMLIRGDPAGPRPKAVVAIQPHGGRPPLFCLPGVGDDIVALYPLAAALGSDQPVLALRNPPGGPFFDTIEQIAERFCEAMLASQPNGPFYLCGYSFGAAVAYDIARQLSARGHAIGLVALIDMREFGWRLTWRNAAATLWQGLRNLPGYLRDRDARRNDVGNAHYILRHVARGQPLSEMDWPAPPVWRANEAAKRAYRAPRCHLPVALFRAHVQYMLSLTDEAEVGWRGPTGGHMTLYHVPGNHHSIVRDLDVQALAAALTDALDMARRSGGDLARDASLPIGHSPNERR